MNKIVKIKRANRKLPKIIIGRFPFQKHFSHVKTNEAGVSGFGHSRGVQSFQYVTR